MIKIGSHITFKAPNYLLDAGKESLKNNANTLMIYLGAPQNTKRVEKEKYKLHEFEQLVKNKINNEDIIVHAPYIVNPSNPTKSQFACNFLISEIKRMNYIKAKYLVLHPGAYTSFDVQQALDTLINNLKLILSKTKDVVIAIETMAGKGTEVGINFEQIMYVINKVNSERIKICLDTCHVWDAGYNLKNFEEFIDFLKEKNYLKYIKVIHLNDSKNDLGSHKDRHENIGKGFIGFDTLAKFVHCKEFDNIPIILETPWIDEGPIYDQEIKLLLNAKK
ncbi:deoxyribonuclease IV [Mycoplasma phocimorsus]|uniref:deoxyribonuclease IV n=1 Tax=Mycoplasma phocimorsus TaxID=3045839 RepID=UPI0024C090EA|nr:deoxyribonuclease IV [Mycoplasma phocimorsus]MDJ1647326.1 deoxyribonuclease IV [Mycoplasma phocimorsus]MDJ1648077.1 deoxyribonuclease IV [Mycoplasma phocimorsus]